MSAPTLVRQNIAIPTASANTLVITLPSVGAGDFLDIGVLTQSNVNVTGATDSSGNTWTISKHQAATTNAMWLLTAKNVAASAGTLTVTITFNFAVQAHSAIITEWSGTPASPIDGTPTGNNIENPGTTTDGCTAGTVTTTNQPATVHSIGWCLGSTLSLGTGYTTAGYVSQSAGAQMGGVLTSEYKTLSSIGAVTPTFTNTFNNASNEFVSVSIVIDGSSTGAATRKTLSPIGTRTGARQLQR